MTIGRATRKSGLPFGICWHAEGRSIRARITADNDKRVSKSFSVIACGGLEMAINAAVAWRSFMIEELNKAGAGYTKLHETGGLYV